MVVFCYRPAPDGTETQHGGSDDLALVTDRENGVVLSSGYPNGVTPATNGSQLHALAIRFWPCCVCSKGREFRWKIAMPPVVPGMSWGRPGMRNWVVPRQAGGRDENPARRACRGHCLDCRGAVSP